MLLDLGLAISCVSVVVDTVVPRTDLFITANRHTHLSNSLSSN